MCCFHFVSFSYFNFIVVVLLQYLLLVPTKVFSKSGPQAEKGWEALIYSIRISISCVILCYVISNYCSVLDNGVSHFEQGEVSHFCISYTIVSVCFCKYRKCNRSLLKK